MLIGMQSSAPKLLRVLVVDEDRCSSDSIKGALCANSVEVNCAESPQEALRACATLAPQLVFIDDLVLGIGAIALLERIIALQPATEVVLMGEQYSSHAALQAIRKGASDYLIKPIASEVLRKRVKDLFGELLRYQRSIIFERQAPPTTHFEGLIGRSTSMQEVFSKLRQVAPHYSSALLTGDTGTGKELAACALHNLSPAKAKAFVAFNCAS